MRIKNLRNLNFRFFNQIKKLQLFFKPKLEIRSRWRPTSFPPTFLSKNRNPYLAVVYKDYRLIFNLSKKMFTAFN